jgi:hypothetical protein
MTHLRVSSRGQASALLVCDTRDPVRRSHGDLLTRSAAALTEDECGLFAVGGSYCADAGCGVTGR